MIREEWNQIVNNQNVRQNLSSIRKALKEGDNLAVLLNTIAGEEQILIRLLDAEDAKTRKNAVLLMGDMGRQEFLPLIYAAYQKESQRFIKSAYLAAIGKFDYKEYLEDLKGYLMNLSKAEVTKETQKHHMEEMRELTSLIVRMEGVTTHVFTGWDNTYDVILLTNRNFVEVTRDELLMLVPDARIRLFNAGVMAQVSNLNWLNKIRTWQEILFVVKGMKTCVYDPIRAAEVITGSSLLPMLAESHRGGNPYYFRVEMKSKRALDERSDFVKKLSGHIEKLSDRQLINTTEKYEFEIRLIENKEGNLNLMVKLYTLRNDRFSYRKEVIPTSIKPVNAALTVALAKEYMKEDAQVLDPFCGVGTMLIERHKSVRANTTYGLDIQEEAILKARQNTETAGQIIHYINRDFFRFQHEYLFDEIITNMPFRIGRVTEEEVYEIYQQFFGTAGRHLKKNALIVLYSHDREYVRGMAPQNGYQIMKEYEISKREGSYVMLLKYMGLPGSDPWST